MRLLLPLLGLLVAGCTSLGGVAPPSDLDCARVHWSRHLEGCEKYR